MHYFVRPHPTKDKPLVTPCSTFKQLRELQKTYPAGQPIRNIGSGEDRVRPNV